MKKKVYMIGISVLIIVIAFSFGVINRLSKPKTGDDILLREGDMIKLGEALELSTHLGLERGVMTEIMGYEHSYDEDKVLVFREMKFIIESASISLDIKKSQILRSLSYSLEEQADNQAVLVSEFLEFFEAIPGQSDKIELVEESLFILGTMKKDSNEYLVTDKGKLIFRKAMNFTKEDHTFDGHLFADKKVKGYRKGDQLLYIKEQLHEPVTLSNVWITGGEDGKIETFLHEISKEFETKYKLSSKIEDKVGDITIEEGKVVKITLKPDTIGGKVLTTTQSIIEIEKFGPLEVDENFKIYKIYGELGMEVTNSILVGYKNTDFVVANGKIVAALIKEPIQAENIRVLVKTNQFADLFHEEIKFTADKGFRVIVGNEEKEYRAGEEVVLNKGDDIFKKGRVYVETNSEEGKIELLSLKRSDGNPRYRGTMEISSEEKGLVVINDVSIEEYLYGVIPSEMPNYFGVDALKVQAICARSYAYKQLFGNAYREYGAHVDDSISYQVYNNIKETEESILAVKDTYGKVIEYMGEIITAYYFSTSSGHTASSWEVWMGGAEEVYLTGKPQVKYDYVDGEVVYASNMDMDTNLSEESAFRAFLEDTKDITYDSEFPWYRWNVTMTMEEITASVDKALANRYNSVPSQVLTLVDGEVGSNPVYESKPIDTVGKVKDIIIEKREKSGILSEIVIVGSKQTVKIISEYNIRAVLAPSSVEVTKQDSSKSSSLSLLPSAFFVMEKGKGEITFKGGGYGHGVGMSQNGVKAMTDEGKSYEEIIKHYYTGTELGYIYGS